MKSVLHLIPGAGPELSMGGLSVMRAPAQHRRPAPHTGWAHPYTGIHALAVWHADGGDDDPAPTPPKPAPPANPAPVPQWTQEDLERIAAKEKSQGERAGARKALEDLAAELGFTKSEDVKTFVAAAREAQEAQKTEEQKRREELERKEQELAQREAAAIARERAASRRETLAGLGASGTDLKDAAALLSVDLADDADAQAVQEAAEKLKERRPELFGAKPAQQPSTLPPAPGGAPAGGQRPGGSRKPGDIGREMLRRRGKLPAS